MILDKLMPSCQEVTRKLAEGDFDNLSWLTRFLVRMHLSMCQHCSRFARQIGLITQALRNIWQTQPKSEALGATKRRILAHLRQS